MSVERRLIKADARLRIIIIVLIIIVLAATLVVYNLFQKYYLTVQVEAESNPEIAIIKMVNILRAIVYINPVIFFLFFLYFFYLGSKTYKTSQYPPPGVKVIRDTYLVEGKKAKNFGIALWIIAIILVAFALYFSFFMNRFIQTII